MRGADVVSVPDRSQETVVPSTLRTAIRTIAAANSSKKRVVDPQTVHKTISALMVIWNALQGAWPKFQKWFRNGLTDEQWDRFTEIANRLPSLTATEREELIELTKLGLRLNRQSPSETEAELPDSELDGDVPAG